MSVVANGAATNEDEWVFSAAEDAERRAHQVKVQQSTAVIRFNTKPKLGLEYLKGLGLWDGSPLALAEWIQKGLNAFGALGLSKRRVGEFFGSNEEISTSTFNAWLRHCVGKELGPNVTLDMALRVLLRKFRLPGESQCIDRVAECFAKAFKAANAEGPAAWPYSEDAAYVLSFSLVMLNTDLHSPSIKDAERMTKGRFVINNRGIDEGGDLPEALLDALYDSIKSDEIKMDEGDLYESHLLPYMGARKAGWLEKCNNRKWKRLWFVLNDGCLYYFRSPQDVDDVTKPPRATIPLDQGLEVKRLVGAAPSREFSLVARRWGRQQDAASPPFPTRTLPPAAPRDAEEAEEEDDDDSVATEDAQPPPPPPLPPPPPPLMTPGPPPRPSSSEPPAPLATSKTPPQQLQPGARHRRWTASGASSDAAPVIKSMKHTPNGPAKGTTTGIKLLARDVAEAQAWADALRAEEESITGMDYSAAAASAASAARRRVLALRANRLSEQQVLQQLQQQQQSPSSSSDRHPNNNENDRDSAILLDRMSNNPVNVALTTTQDLTPWRQENSHKPLYSGWLRKRGEINTAWKKRYFALFSGVTCTDVDGVVTPADEPVLMYFTDEAKFHELIGGSLSRPYQGAIRLGAVKEMKRKNGDSAIGKTAILALVTDDRTWLLAPVEESAESDLDPWWYALEGACHAAQLGEAARERILESRRSSSGSTGSRSPRARDPVVRLGSEIGARLGSTRSSRAL